MKLILDTSSLIAFYTEACSPPVLSELNKHGFEILVPFSVANEITEKDKSYRYFAEHLKSDVIEVLEESNDSDISRLGRRYPYLGDGEIEVLLWALEFERRSIDYICILDDKRARRIASGFSLSFTGTIGLIKSFEEWGIASADCVIELLGRLTSSGFRYKASNSKYK